MAGYIAGIGGANVDIHGQSDAPIVMRDSNPGRLHLSAGGVCRNICDNLCRLGLTVELCSAVGGDAYGDMLRGACTAAGIGTRHLAVFPAQNTSAYISIMDSEGDMLVAMSDMHILKEALTPSYVEGLLPVLNGADVCVADANLSAGALETLATRCTVPLMLDPVSTAWARNAAPLAGYFHTLKPNLMEMEVLSGMRITNERELDAACGMLLEKGVYQVFVSLGREGLYFRRQGCGALRKKSRPFPMKNATGAGDATMAGIVYAWVNGLSPGDTLTLENGEGREGTFTVTGVAENYVENYVYMTPSVYEDAYGSALEYNSVLGILPDDAQDVDEAFSTSLFLVQSGCHGYDLPYSFGRGR